MTDRQKMNARILRSSLKRWSSKTWSSLGFVLILGFSGSAQLCSAQDTSQYFSDMKTANKYFRQGHYKQAHDLFEQALSLADAADSALVSQSAALTNLAASCAALGRYKESEVLFKRALNYQPKGVAGALLNGKSGKSILYNDMAYSYLSQSRFIEAENALQEAIALAKGPKQGLYLSALATTYVKWGKYDKASAEIEKAESLFDTPKKRSTSEYIFCLFAKGQLSLALGKFKESENDFREALDVVAKVETDEHPDYAKALQYLASVQRKTKQLEQAEKNLEKAKAILAKAYSEDHPDIALLMIDMADLYCDQGRYKEAEPIVRKAQDITELSVGAKTLNECKCLESLASIYRHEGYNQDAEKYLHQSLETKQQILGLRNVSAATTQRLLAQVLTDEGKFAEADSLLNESTSTLNEFLDPGNNELAENAKARNKLAESKTSKGSSSGPH